MPSAKQSSSATTKSGSATPATKAAPDLMEIIKIRAAKAWRPNPGDMLQGTVVKMLARESDYGVYPVVVMDTGDEGYTAVHAFHTILKDALRELKTTTGDDLTIVYEGKLESRNAAGKNEDGTEKKRTYHNYFVIGNGVDSTVEFTWDDSTDEDEPDF